MADPDAEGPRSSPRSPEPATERPRFQFLEQKYGYYHCKDCNIRWESAYVWCVQGTNKVYFKQFCRTCQKSYNPYRVEDITCQIMRHGVGAVLRDPNEESLLALGAFILLINLAT
ncbi:Zygote arrest protein 1 [Vulpes lagopus]